MNRRAFLQNLSFVCAGFAFSEKLISQECGPVMPTMTPLGIRPIQLCTVGIPSLSFRQAYQQMNEWCWAACISMIYEFHGHPVSQIRIVQETWGSVQNMPGSPMAILANLNKKWTDDRGEEFESEGDVFSVNVQSAVEDLQGGNPLIIGAIGHATVLTALTIGTDQGSGQQWVQQAIVRDPFPGMGGKRLLSANEWNQISFAARIRVS